MREGIQQRKEQLSVLVSTAARAEEESKQEAAEEVKEDIVALEIMKETSVEFNPQAYLTSSDD